jgi:subfamily B ATP-binding cassette protein MsbA
MAKNEKPERVWGRLFGFVKPFNKVLGISVMLGVLFSIFTTLPFPIFKIVLDLIFQESLMEMPDPSGEGWLSSFMQEFNNFFVGLIYDPNDKRATLINLGVLITIIFIIKNVVKYLMIWAQTYLQNGIVKSIRDSVFKNLTSLSINHFSKARQGNFISIMTNDVEVLNNATIMASIKIFKDTLEVLFKIFYLIAISPFLILVSLGISLLTFVVLKFSRKYLKRYAKRMQESMADFTSTMQETISGIKIIQAYSSQRKATDRFENDTNRYLRSTVKHKKIVSIVPGMGEIFAILSLCVVLVVGGDMVHSGEIDSSSLLTFIVVLFGVMGPINAIVNAIAGYQRGFVAAGRVFELLDAKSNIISGNKNPTGIKREIILNNLDFSYEDNNVLNNINLMVPKGKKVAFVGASGSGKSTILNLILRFYDPQKGEIEIDGENIKNYQIDKYRQMFGLVSQDTILFNDTLRNNIKYGNDSASDEEIERCLKAAHAFDFVSNLPNYLDENVGDRGGTLSGGERQRIAIARALVRDPDVLVFDEATSALDSESEKIVQEAINDALQDRTAIIVAHRLATILDCDIIYVFEAGRIVESGNHEELIANNGVYKKLYDIQFGK